MRPRTDGSAASNCVTGAENVQGTFTRQRRVGLLFAGDKSLGPALAVYTCIFHPVMAAALQIAWLLWYLVDVQNNRREKYAVPCARRACLGHAVVSPTDALHTLAIMVRAVGDEY
jgi:hypothetical protein